jgi:hypothetical protein
MADDPRTRDALQAVAFGRVVTPEGEAAAVRAFQALRGLDERAASPTLEPVIVEVADHSRAAASQAMNHDDRSGTRNRFTETRRRLWVVPLVVASIAVGAIGGAAATRAVEKPQADLVSVGPATAAADPMVPDPQNAAAAITSFEEWLDRPQQPIDVFPDERSLTNFGVDSSSTHFVTAPGLSEDTPKIWVARGSDSSRSWCLVVVPPDGNLRTACIPEEDFSRDGVSVATGPGAFVHWDSSGVRFDAGAKTD